MDSLNSARLSSLKKSNSEKPETADMSTLYAARQGALPRKGNEDLLRRAALKYESGTPQRTASGFDLRRLQLLLAVLEKRGGFHFGTKDVFVNIAGGLKIEDPAIDLAMVFALLSSYEDVPLSQKICFAGEIGLSGEIRAVNRIDQRISEAEKLGFEKIVVSKYNRRNGTRCPKTSVVWIIVVFYN